MVNDDETLLNQLIEDLQEELSTHEGFENIVVKAAYEDFPAISYPMVLINEIENSAVSQFYDGEEHIVNVTYQLFIFAEQDEYRTAVENVRQITTIIRDYMRGERYHALKRLGNTPITKKQDDENIRIGYMRFVGRIDIDTHTIYRRN